MYNRGASFGIAESKDKEGRYQEMRNIKALMEQRRYDKIPEQFILMKRLWVGKENLRGVVLRRDAEATLFLMGLDGLS